MNLLEKFVLHSFTPGRCAYAPIGQLSSKDCKGKLAFVVHDRRGCLMVCQGHAEFRGVSSMAIGHSASCPYRFESGPWKHITVV